MGSFKQPAESAPPQPELQNGLSEFPGACFYHGFRALPFSGNCLGLGAQPETKTESLQRIVLSKNFHESAGSAHINVLS